MREPETSRDMLIRALDAVVNERVGEALAQAGSPERWYRVKEAAEILALSTGTIRNRIKEGRLQAETDGRRIVISASAIRAYRDASRNATGTPEEVPADMLDTEA